MQHFPINMWGVEHIQYSVIDTQNEIDGWYLCFNIIDSLTSFSITLIYSELKYIWWDIHRFHPNPDLVTYRNNYLCGQYGIHNVMKLYHFFGLHGKQWLYLLMDCASYLQKIWVIKIVLLPHCEISNLKLPVKYSYSVFFI